MTTWPYPSFLVDVFWDSSSSLGWRLRGWHPLKRFHVLPRSDSLHLFICPSHPRIDVALSRISRLHRAYTRITSPRISKTRLLMNFMPSLITLITLHLRLLPRMNSSTIRHRINALDLHHSSSSSAPPPHRGTTDPTCLCTHTSIRFPPTSLFSISSS